MGRGSHGPGAVGGSHSHSEEYPEDTWNLYQHISNTRILNAETEVDVFKPFVRRLTSTRIVSDSDPELMIVVHFASPVSLRRLMCIGTECRLRLFVGEMDFTSVEDSRPSYHTSLPSNEQGEAYVNVHPPSTFTNITCLTFFFDSDQETTEIQYIGMQGDHSHDKREAVNATYEILGQTSHTKADQQHYHATV